MFMVINAEFDMFLLGLRSGGRVQGKFMCAEEKGGGDQLLI